MGRVSGFVKVFGPRDLKNQWKTVDFTFSRSGIIKILWIFDENLYIFEDVLDILKMSMLS